MAYNDPEILARKQAARDARLAAEATPLPQTRSGPDQMRDVLEPYGLGDLANRAWEYFQTNQPSEAELLTWIREQPEHELRYPGFKALQNKGRAINEGDYVSIERQYVQLFRQAGLPSGFYDSPDDFASFISNEVSPQEMSARLDVARIAVYETPPEVRAELSRLYNVGTGDVMAFLLDPTKALPIIQNQFTAAEAGAASQLSGYGALTRGEAERVGLSGRNFDQLTQGFDQLAQSQELFQPIIGEVGQDSLTREDQLGAAFGGNTSAQRRLERRAKQRAAVFEGGGGFAETNKGITGLSSAAS